MQTGRNLAVSLSLTEHVCHQSGCHRLALYHSQAEAAHHIGKYFLTQATQCVLIELGSTLAMCQIGLLPNSFCQYRRCW